MFQPFILNSLAKESQNQKTEMVMKRWTPLLPPRAPVQTHLGF